MKRRSPEVNRKPRLMAGIALGAIAVTALVVPLATAEKGGGGGDQQKTLPTSLEDFMAPGTQPNPDTNEFRGIVSSANCMFCHADYGLETPPYDTWVVSLMAQSARDPVFHAAFTIANQDADKAGSFCIRCHVPAAHYNGNGDTSEIPEFDIELMDGINCHFCHRVVNPAGGAMGYEGELDDPDSPILADLAAAGHFPVSVGNGQIIVDPDDVRRGPYDDVPANYHGYDQDGQVVRIITSPFHRDSTFCGGCHDVSNPVFVLDEATGKGVVSEMGTEHPTHDVYDMVPEQRTYSEWLNSDFADGGVVFEDGRFGGALPDDAAISSCQDCHMPIQVGGACSFYEGPPFFERPDVGAHAFAGGNTWVLDAVAEAAGIDADYYGLTEDRLEAANARTEQMLRDASDMELAIDGDSLNIRIINQGGHKLPTGYSEGRQMWLNVRFLDAGGNLIAERGAYDLDTAELHDEDTKVYKKTMGISEEVAKIVNLPAGESTHLALNNEVLFDNRIPARGFTNEAYAAFGGAPKGASYEDGQYWDDTSFEIPKGTAEAVATLFFQTSTREYMEFLRDANVTDDRGQVAYDLWVSNGKSAPFAMDMMSINVIDDVPGDLNGDGIVSGADVGILLVQWGPCPGECTADFNGDGVVDGADFGILLTYWFG
ncbi:MAG: hypothetical protein CBB69_010415 [Phycisphaera sp. TMED9]|nr:dockerin type I repeat-containing protein [bacterium]RPG14970.1 MAG: hypothetical protein CBB69_010415 [Phycisphaera sp. TMED9]